MMWHERHGIWNNWPHDYFSNSVFRITSKRTSKLHVTGPMWPLVNWTHKGPIMWKITPWHDVIIDSKWFYLQTILVTQRTRVSLVGFVCQMTWLGIIHVHVRPTESGSIANWVSHCWLGTMVLKLNVTVTDLGWNLLKLHLLISPLRKCLALQSTC